MTPAGPRPRPGIALPIPPRWQRALNRGAVLLVLGTLGTCSLGVLRGIHPPFSSLYAMGQVAVFMEFHDRGMAGPAFISRRASDSRQLPCFREGAPDLALAPGADCESGLFHAEGTYTRAWIPWSQARESGVLMPAFLLHTGVGARLLSYAEAPCRAVRDFETVVQPARPGGRGLDWLVQEMRDIRRAFDCDGTGLQRPEHRASWAAMTFRLHLYDATGRVVLTLDTTPGWIAPRQETGAAGGIWRVPGVNWLPDQFPPPARLDPPGARAHSSP